MNSIFEKSSVGFAELPAKSSVPWVWFGFFFALAFLVCEFLYANLDLVPEFRFAPILIGLAAWIYWLFCVFRFHTILREITRNHYRITGPEAVGYHFIPFYNFYWIFKWSSDFSDYLNMRGRVKVVSGKVLGAGMLAGVLLARYLDGAIGLFIVFGIGTYLAAKLESHITEIKGLTPEMLPPLPDASMFDAVPRQ
jgi:hypothetical protein